MTTETMNPVEHALLLTAEFLQPDTDTARSVEILADLRVLAGEMGSCQKDEFRQRANELAVAGAR